jgi:hypothetical protein
LCVVCGHESPGWNLPGAASSARAGDHGRDGDRFLTAGAHSGNVVSAARAARHSDCAAA